MATLLLIRHAPTAETGTRLTGRTAGVSLNADGLRIARDLAENLADRPISAVYTSPIERTWETAEAVAEPHGLKPTVHQGLIEIDFGTWTGRTLPQLRRTNLWRSVVATPSRVRFPEGETFAGAQRRAVAACEDIASAAGKRTVAVVSHADVIKMVLSYYLGQPLDMFQRIAIEPASVSVVMLTDSGGPFISGVNTRGGSA